MSLESGRDLSMEQLKEMNKKPQALPMNSNPQSTPTPEAQISKEDLELLKQNAKKARMENYFAMGGCEYLGARQFDEPQTTVDDAVCGIASIIQALQTGDNDRFHIKNHIKPNIGSIPLNKLTTLDLQKLYKKLLTEGRVDRIESKKQPKGLSAKMVRNINQIISSALNLAKEQKLIYSNPADACALPKVEHREMQTLTAEQLDAFFREAKASGVYEMYYIELATGLRRGELRGLKWDDIDMKNGVIRVQRQVARINGEIVEAPLKTKNSYRNVSIGPDAIEVLEEQKKKVGDSGYVFPSPNGGPISPDSVLNMLHRVLERAGLP